MSTAVSIELLNFVEILKINYKTIKLCLHIIIISSIHIYTYYVYICKCKINITDLQKKINQTNDVNVIRRDVLQIVINKVF